MLLPLHLWQHVNLEDESCQGAGNGNNAEAWEIELNDEELQDNNQQKEHCPQENGLLDGNMHSFQLPDKEVAEVSVLFDSMEKEPDNAVEYACDSKVLHCLDEKLMAYKHEICNCLVLQNYVFNTYVTWRS